VIVRSGREIDRELVVDVRGSLHHYGSATGAWLVTTGRIAGSAREEAKAEGAAPCALFSGHDLARSMEQLGIGIKQYFVPLCDIDFDLLEALGDGASMRRDRAPEHARFDRDRGRAPEDREPQEPGEHEADELGDEEAPEPKKEFDLLDPAIAEESRLVTSSPSWEPPDDEREGELEDEPDADSAELAAAIAEGDDEAADALDEGSAADDEPLDDEPADER
jgi:hypothetical protein